MGFTFVPTERLLWRTVSNNNAIDDPLENEQNNIFTKFYRNEEIKKKERENPQQDR